MVNRACAHLRAPQFKRQFRIRDSSWPLVASPTFPIARLTARVRTRIKEALVAHEWPPRWERHVDGFDRCRCEGHVGMNRWVGLGVIADNPVNIGRARRRRGRLSRQAGTDSGLLSFSRLSARAIDAVIAAGRNGIDGFYEVVWPTGTIAIWSSKLLLCGPAM
jgi:hypothetical protein